ncbi:hypothetical protein ABL840_32180 [Variovorax sp. NFACC27]|uniref:hypothetical protein n=1 Tax=unclassified Variovorax TaxID=663243 RepID=UPI0015A3FFC8|nr:hypothetical protein [Variovorax paradoxus]
MQRGRNLADALLFVCAEARRIRAFSDFVAEHFHRVGLADVQEKRSMKKKGLTPLMLACISPCIGFNDAQEIRLSRKKIWPSLVLACMTGLSAAACAASATASGGSTAVDAALKACAASVAKDASGGPDQTAMTACMTKAGFTKPPQEGEHRPPPPAGAALRK